MNGPDTALPTVMSGKTHRPALLLGTIIPFQSEQEQKGQQVLQDRCGHTKTLLLRVWPVKT